ncbi:MAG TPA: sugar phosphate isomerase/epimerase family protein [Gaiellaceae bacterium]
MSTLSASFADDVRAYTEAGVDGIGVWEIKLGDGSLDEFRASGLGSATAVPAVPSVHPLPLLPGPGTVRERVDALLRSLEILAPYEPPAILCFTGPGDRETAVRGVREVAREAERLGLRLAVEPFEQEGIESWSILNTLSDAAEFVDEVGSDAVGIQFDAWHLWNTADVLEEMPRYARLIAGVHVSDWREPTRGWADRVLPGNGAADLPALLGVLEDVGWEGFYDLEVFSDNGTFGNAYPDSLWDLDAAELARRGRDAFFHTWSKRRVPAEAAGRRGET